MQFPEHLARWREIEKVSITHSLTPEKKAYLKHTIKTQLGQYWELSLETVLLSYLERVELRAFIDHVGGRFGVFNLKNPFPSNGIGGGNPTVRTDLTAGGNAIAIDGLLASRQKVWFAGDFIQFANHPKVYQVSFSCNSSGTGQTTATIFPELIKDVPAGTAIIWGSEVNWQLELEQDASDFAIDAGKGKQGSETINCKEVG